VINETINQTIFHFVSIDQIARFKSVQMSIDPKQKILVTGFGPFDKHVVNASWEAAKELQKLWTKSGEFPGVELIIKEIPVSYNYVSTCIPQLWEKHRPTVSSITNNSNVSTTIIQ